MKLALTIAMLLGFGAGYYVAQRQVLSYVPYFGQCSSGEMPQPLSDGRIVCYPPPDALNRK